MSRPTVEELDRLAEHLAVSTAPWLAWAVHTRDPGLVAELLDSLTHQDLLALAVTLASQVPQPGTRPDDGVVDEVAVQRAADGQVGPLTRAERAAAIAVMARRGVPSKHIERRLRVSYKTIRRVLSEHQRETA